MVKPIVIKFRLLDGKRTIDLIKSTVEITDYKKWSLNVIKGLDSKKYKIEFTVFYDRRHGIYNSGIYTTKTSLIEAVNSFLDEDIIKEYGEKALLRPSKQTIIKKPIKYPRR